MMGATMQSTQTHRWTGASPSRVLSVDVLRGFTIALMILVNDPGDWTHVYSQLDHAPWNGFTLTDLVFPNFLFLVGVSIIFSLESRIARGESRRTLALHIFRRAALLFLIKLLLSAFPHFHLAHLRLYGVLTRIALCYLAAGLLCLATRRARALLTIAAALLIGYWALMRFVPIPGLGIPTHGFPILDPDRNLAAWLDRAVNAFTQRTLHTGSLYNRTRDPEGLLSTLPALATTLIGCVTALWLRRADPSHTRETRISRTYCLTGLIVSGLLSLTAGLLWNPWFPINKNLWTSTSNMIYSWILIKQPSLAVRECLRRLMKLRAVSYVEACGRQLRSLRCASMLPSLESMINDSGKLLSKGMPLELAVPRQNVFLGSESYSPFAEPDHLYSTVIVYGDSEG